LRIHRGNLLSPIADVQCAHFASPAENTADHEANLMLPREFTVALQTAGNVRIINRAL
jgi:hypothetical protein